MIVYSHEYSSAYDPSAPVTEIVICNPVPSSAEVSMSPLRLLLIRRLMEP